jgi:hypothetical protein
LLDEIKGCGVYIHRDPQHLDMSMGNYINLDEIIFLDSTFYFKCTTDMDQKESKKVTSILEGFFSSVKRQKFIDLILSPRPKYAVKKWENMMIRNKVGDLERLQCILTLLQNKTKIRVIFNNNAEGQRYNVHIKGFKIHLNREGERELKIKIHCLVKLKEVYQLEVRENILHKHKFMMNIVNMDTEAKEMKTVQMDSEPELSEVPSVDKVVVRNILYAAWALQHSDRNCISWNVQTKNWGYIINVSFSNNFSISLRDMQLLKDFNPLRIEEVMLRNPEKSIIDKTVIGAVLVIKLLNQDQPVAFTESEVIRIRKRHRWYSSDSSI